jgi:hypothetical protein
MTLWKVTAGGVRLTDELFTVRTPCGVRPRDRDTGGVADRANGSIPAFTPGHDNGALSGYGLINQPCQLFSDALGHSGRPTLGSPGVHRPSGC